MGPVKWTIIDRASEQSVKDRDLFCFSHWNHKGVRFNNGTIEKLGEVRGKGTFAQREGDVTRM